MPSLKNISEVAKTSSNATSPAAASLPTYIQQPLATLVLQLTLWSTISLLGLVGNLLVCIVILSRRKMKASMNYYLLSLSIADMGILLFNCPISILRYLKPFEWLLGKDSCLYLLPTTEVFLGSSIWSITAIAVERYRNIVGARRYWRRRSLTTSRFVIVAIWLVSFGVSSIPLYPIMTYDPSLKICGPRWPDYRGKNIMMTTYFICLTFVWYLLPLGIITLTYMKITKKVDNSDMFRRSMKDATCFKEASTPARRLLSQSNKTKRILTPLAILFAVAMLPLVVFRLVLLVRPLFWKDEYYILAFGVCIMCTIINSSANPVLYYIVSKDFKDAFRNVLQNLRQRGHFFKRLRGSSKYTSTAVARVSDTSFRIKNTEEVQYISGV